MTSGWPSPASAAPSISCPASSARGASGGWRPTGWPSCSSFNPARRYGAAGQGRHRRRLDADLVLLDPERHFTVRAADSPSGQGYTPFEGQELTGQVQATFLRGRLAWENGAVVGAARGRYIARPTSRSLSLRSQGTGWRSSARNRSPNAWLFHSPTPFTSRNSSRRGGMTTHHVAERGVAEDQVGRHAALLGDRAPQRSEPLEQQRIGGDRRALGRPGPARRPARTPCRRRSPSPPGRS